MKLFAAVLLTIAMLVGQTVAAGFVGNVNGAAGKYSVFEFTAAGNPARPVSGSSFAGVAWPSAVQIGSTTYMFASVLVGGRWNEIHRWSSTNGAAYVHDSAVLVADSTESYGVGPATLHYDGSTFSLFYLVRGASGPGSTIELATSTDGINFTRQGTVYTANGTTAPGGLSLSYACVEDGNSYLFMHGYAAGLTTGSSFVASATSASGTHRDVGVILQPSGYVGTVSGSIGNSFVATSGTFPVGQPIVINDGVKPEVFLVDEAVTGAIYLDRPLEKSYSAAAAAHFLSNKADLSFVRQEADGTWLAGVTGYGQFSGILSEFTGHAHSDDLTGPYTMGEGYALNPYFASGEISTENPEPIRTDESCSG